MKRKDFKSGCAYTQRLINLRLRSEKEILDKLKLRGFDPGAVEQVISYFKDIGLIDDREFALAWINSRLRKPLGLSAISIELKAKGIKEELINELLDDKRKSLDEFKIVKQLADEQLMKLTKKNVPAQKIKPRLCAFLIRRGYSGDCVNEVIGQIGLKTL